MNKISFVIALSLLFVGACKKDDNNSNNTGNKSVDVECTVNGRDWKLSKNDSFNIDGIAGNKGASVIATLRGKNLSFSIQKWDKTDTAAVVITAVLGDTVVNNYPFNFGSDPANMHYIRYIKLDRSSGPPADMVNSVGFLKVTAYDPVTKVFSGEFEAEVTNRSFRGMMSTVSISKGKFTNIQLN